MMQPKTKYKIHLGKNVSLLGLGGEMVKVYQILLMMMFYDKPGL